MKKKILTVLGILLGILVLGSIAFKFRYDKMVRTIEEQDIATVGLDGVPDGTYSGSFGDFLLYVELEVTVTGGRIMAVEMLDQRSGPGYEALETLDRIVEAQTPVVDAVTGATGSSRCIMIAVYRALREGEAN